MYPENVLTKGQGQAAGKKGGPRSVKVALGYGNGRYYTGEKTGSCKSRNLSPLVSTFYRLQYHTDTALKVPISSPRTRGKNRSTRSSFAVWLEVLYLFFPPK